LRCKIERECSKGTRIVAVGFQIYGASASSGNGGGGAGSGATGCCSGDNVASGGDARGARGEAAAVVVWSLYRQFVSANGLKCYLYVLE